MVKGNETVKTRFKIQNYEIIARIRGKDREVRDDLQILFVFVVD